MILIVFGLAASGKTYIGKVLNKYFNFYHEDADLWLSTDMKEYINEKKIFTLNMLESFTSNIITNVEKLQSSHKNIIISQALYRSKNRDMIKEHFSSHDLMFLQVEASDEMIHQRLVKRGDWVLPGYAASMRKFFQPMEDVNVINNNQSGEESIIEQLLNIPEIAKFHISKIESK